MADIPIKEGLFHIPDGPEDKPYFIGSRCRVCGYTGFPKKVVCVSCRRDDTMEEMKLGPYANLETYTMMMVGPPDFPPPYMIGYVKMKEGPVIFTLLTDCDVENDAPEIGEEMELVIEKVKEDEKGNNLIGWKFRPARRKV